MTNTNAPTTPKRPRTILAVEEMLTERAANARPSDRLFVKLDHAAQLLADANREIEKLEARVAELEAQS